MQRLKEKKNLGKSIINYKTTSYVILKRVEYIIVYNSLKLNYYNIGTILVLLILLSLSYLPAKIVSFGCSLCYPNHEHISNVIRLCDIGRYIDRFRLLQAYHRLYIDVVHTCTHL